MTAGFIAVFAVFGLVIAPLASGLQQYLPWVTLVVGIALVLAGLWQVAGRSLRADGRVRTPPHHSHTLHGVRIVFTYANVVCPDSTHLLAELNRFLRVSSVQHHGWERLARSLLIDQVANQLQVVETPAARLRSSELHDIADQHLDTLVVCRKLLVACCRQPGLAEAIDGDDLTRLPPGPDADRLPRPATPWPETVL